MSRTRYVEFEHDGTGKTVQAKVVQSLFNGQSLEVGWLTRSGRTTIATDKVRYIAKPNNPVSP